MWKGGVTWNQLKTFSSTDVFGYTCNQFSLDFTWIRCDAQLLNALSSFVFNCHITHTLAHTHFLLQFSPSHCGRKKSVVQLEQTQCRQLSSSFQFKLHKSLVDFKRKINANEHPKTLLSTHHAEVLFLAPRICHACKLTMHTSTNKHTRHETTCYFASVHTPEWPKPENPFCVNLIEKWTASKKRADNKRNKDIPSLTFNSYMCGYPMHCTFCHTHICMNVHTISIEFLTNIHHQILH